MSITSDCFEILERLSLYSKQDICRALSLSLDIPELFDITDKELFRKLRDYEGAQAYVENGEDDYTDDEDSY